jgi:hydrogenase maturation protein HypF
LCRVPRALHIEVDGVVQGVGFRPFVFRLATSLGLAGTVRNGTRGVEIEVEGEAESMATFVEMLRSAAPPHAVVEALRIADRPPRGDTTFCIQTSVDGCDRAPPLTPDIAACTECVDEALDGAGRRGGYYLTTCSACGPRYTFVDRLPYDREHTSMRAFPLCSECRAEYDDPHDRRFHAQSLSCPACGPSYRVLDGGDVVGACVDAIDRGLVVAIEGIGGYHLACDATDEQAVQRVRKAKGRDAKPLAVMVETVDAAAALAHVSREEEALLASAGRPIVLLIPRDEQCLAPGVASNVSTIGIMLAYTPLHHALLRAVQRPLVMTSANRSEAPIRHRDPEPLRGLANVVLTHGRTIVAPCDDSVAQVVAGAPMLLRRARGYVPGALPLPAALPPTLAVGGHLKAAVAFARGDRAVLGPHIGDLEGLDARRRWEDVVAHLGALLDVRPEALVHDSHPDYASTIWARRSALPRIAVQHHHAHMAAVLAEHGIEGPAIGVCFDGAGLGDDRTIWGGEFLVGDCRGYERAAHLAVVPQVGGEMAVHEPWRMTVAHALAAGCEVSRIEAAVGRERVDAIRRVIEAGRGPRTSSAGRLFDAVAAALGCIDGRFDGSPAMWLEHQAHRTHDDGAYDFEVSRILDPTPMWRALAADLAADVAAPVIARRFHLGLAHAVARTCGMLRDRTGVAQVVLGGGVFQNGLFTAAVVTRLRALDFPVAHGQRVPPNDGCLAYGQLAVAAARRSAT